LIQLPDIKQLLEKVDELWIDWAKQSAKMIQLPDIVE
jgi:hypothetical protein